MPCLRVAFVTNETYPHLTRDDQLLAAALRRRGAEVVPALWRDPDVPWESMSVVLMRSPWDYVERVKEFYTLLRILRAHPRVLNPVPLMEWNLDKTYLGELAARGVPIVPTEFVPAGSRVDLRALAQGRGWAEVVVKPAISAGAYKTLRVGDGRWEQGQALLDACSAETMMVQPFLPAIEVGEVSLIYFGGEFSHALRKVPARGDFRSQEEFGSFLHAWRPEPPVQRAADRVMAALPEVPLYARVDLLFSAEGEALLGEVELVEPSLYLAYSPDAADRLAERIIGHSAAPNV